MGRCWDSDEGGEMVLVWKRLYVGCSESVNMEACIAVSKSSLAQALDTKTSCCQYSVR